MRTTVQGPDGGYITVEHPEGASDEQIIAFAQANYKPTPIKIGAEGLTEAARQVGTGQSPLQAFATGVGSAAQRIAAGLSQINRMTPMGALSEKLFGLPTVSQEALNVAKATKQGAGGMATAGDILGSIAMSAAVPANVLTKGVTPFSNLAGISGTSGLIAALTTPGDIVERGKEAGISALASSVIPGVTAVAQAGRRVSTQAGRELGRAEILRREIGQEAENLPSLLRAPYPNAPLGVTPTAAMKTQNPTLQALELGARTKRPDLFSAIDESNALKRWQALLGIAKDDSTLAAAQATRDRVTSGLRQEALDLAMQKQGFEIPVAKAVTKIQQGGSRSNPAVKSMTKYVMDELEQGVTPEQLYTIRKTLTDAIPHGTELGNAVKQARVERVSIVKAIDDALDDASQGAWGLYLKAYGGFSGPVTSMKVGQQLTGLFEHSPARTSAATGSIPLMSPGTLSRGLERFGQKELGGKTFERLTPPERKTVEMVIDDLLRQQDVMRARGIIGSDTAAKIAAGSRGDAIGAGLLGMATQKVVPGPAGGLLSDAVTRGFARKREEALAEILRDPEKLARALEAAKRAQDLRVASGVPSIGLRVGGYD